MFPLHSLLRYYPSNDGPHDTAKVLENGILHIKGPSGPRCLYSSVEEWLQTLPGSPTLSMIHVSSKEEENKKQHKMRCEKRERVMAEKKKIAWNIPRLRIMARSLPWARRIYELIREHHRVCHSGLLQREDMRLAFNHLVDVLTEHSDQLHTCTPLHKYDETLCDISYLKYIIIPTRSISMEHALSIVIPVYEPLHIMLCDNVFPYIKQILKDRQKRKNIALYKRGRDTYVKRFMKLTAKYEHQAAILRRALEFYQGRLEEVEAQ